MRRLRTSPTGGFTLIEVILAIAVLGFGLAMLSEGLRLAMMNGRKARDETTAQLLAESKMGELASGAVGLSASSGTCEEPFGSWTYAIECEGTDISDFVAVKVTVTQDLPGNKEPASFTLWRWMADPGVDLSAAMNSQTDSSGSSDSNSTTNLNLDSSSGSSTTK